MAQRFLPVLLSRLRGGLRGLTLLLLDCEPPLVEPLREHDERLPPLPAGLGPAPLVAAVVLPHSPAVTVFPFSVAPLTKLSEDFEMAKGSLLPATCCSLISELLRALLPATCCSTFMELLRMAAAAAKVADGVAGASP